MMVKLNELDEQDRQVSGLIASAHNHSLQQGMMYARAIDVLEQRAQRIQSAFVAEQSESKQLGDELVSVREKVAIIEVERDDLQSELCKKRTEIDSINVQVLRLAEALKVADEQVLAKGMLLDMGEQEIAGLKQTIELLETTPMMVTEKAIKGGEFEMNIAKASPTAMASLSDALDDLPLGTAEEERARAQAWMSTAAQHCRNEEYWRRRSEANEKPPEPQASRAEYQMTPEQAEQLAADQAEEAGTRG